MQKYYHLLFNRNIYLEFISQLFLVEDLEIFAKVNDISGAVCFFFGFLGLFRRCLNQVFALHYKRIPFLLTTCYYKEY